MTEIAAIKEYYASNIRTVLLNYPWNGIFKISYEQLRSAQITLKLTMYDAYVGLERHKSRDRLGTRGNVLQRTA